MFVLRSYMLLGLLSAALATAWSSGENYDYVLQTVPLVFTKDPESHSVLPGSLVTFQCGTAGLEPLSYYSFELLAYPSPRLSWRKNNIQLPPGASITISTSLDLTSSELHIASVSELDAGSYQCVLEDGIAMGSGEANFISISRPAVLDIIIVDDTVSGRVESVEVGVGAPLLLACLTGSSQPPPQVQWSKDGAPLDTLTGDWDVLSNGSLLVFAASSDVEGAYQCRGWFPDAPGSHVDSLTYNVTLTQAPTPTAPVLEVVLLDSPGGGELIAGGSLNLTCYTLALAEGGNYTLTWTHGQQELESGLPVSGVRHEYSLPEVGSGEVGEYSCSLMRSGSTVAHATVEITVISPPILDQQQPPAKTGPDIDSSHLINTQITNSLWDYVVISCNLNDPTAEVYLYKDGVDISDDLELFDGNLEYFQANYLDLLGMYQCFAVNHAGSAHTFTRVLAIGFANPPVNVTCTATFQQDGMRPAVDMGWVSPLLDTVDTMRFIRKYDIKLLPDGRSERLVPGSTNTTGDQNVTLDLTAEGFYLVQVYLRDRDAPIDGALSDYCVFHSNNRFPVSELQVDCPTDPGSHIHVQWSNPSRAIYDSQVKLLDLYIGGNCVNDTLEYHGTGRSAPSFTLPNGSITAAPGSECTFEGNYTLEDRPTFQIPPVTVTCAVPTAIPTTVPTAAPTTATSTTVPTATSTTEGPTVEPGSSFYVTFGPGTGSTGLGEVPVWWVLLLSVVLVVVAVVALLVLTLLAVVCLRRRKRRLAAEHLKGRLVEVIAGSNVISTDLNTTSSSLFDLPAYFTAWDAKSSTSTVYDRLYEGSHDAKSVVAEPPFPPRHASEQSLEAGSSLVMDMFLKSQSSNSVERNSEHEGDAMKSSSSSDVLANASHDSEKECEGTKPVADSGRESLNDDTTSYDLAMSHQLVNYMHSAGSSSGYGTDNYCSSDYNNSMPDSAAWCSNIERDEARLKHHHMLSVCEEEHSHSTDEVSTAPPSYDQCCSCEDLKDTQRKISEQFEKSRDLGSTVLLTPSIEDINLVDSRCTTRKSSGALSPTSKSDSPFTDGKGYVHMDTLTDYSHGEQAASKAAYNIIL